MSTLGDGPGAEEVTEKLRQIADEELGQAFQRFWARVRNLPDEHFAAAVCGLDVRVARELSESGSGRTFVEVRAQVGITLDPSGAPGRGPRAVGDGWEVEYFVRGDVSKATQFYGAGTYEFLLTPNYTTVYLNEPGPLYLADGTSEISLISVLLGYYGEVVLPDGFPTISFPSGYDQAVVVPVPGTSSGTVAPSAPTNRRFQ